MPPRPLRLFLILCLLTIFTLPGTRCQTPTKSTAFHGLPVRSNLAAPAVEKKIDALLKEMTLEEKVGQLVQYSVGAPTGPETGPGGYEEMVQKGQVGSLYNLRGVQDANFYQHVAIEKSRLRIPLINGLDVFTATALNFLFPWDWRRRGIRKSSKKPLASPPRRPPLRAFVGRSRRWSISRAMRVGVV